jgi:MFS family permease
MTIASAWFDRQRNLAVSLVSAGMGMSPLVVAPLVRWLISAYDWRVAMMTLGIAAIVVLIPVALLIRKPPPVIPEPGMPDHPMRTAPAEPPMTAAQAFRTYAFVALALTHFACCAAHSGPIFHMVANAVDHGVTAMAAATILSAAGLASFGVKIVCGLIADRVGVKRTLVAGLGLQAAAIALYLVTRELSGFYAVALMFGFAYGGVMPLYAVVVREYFGARTLGAIFGAVSAVATLGMALGPVAGGWLYDGFGSYAWLFVGSFGIGLGAMAIALAFRPPRPVVAGRPLPSAAS